MLVIAISAIIGLWLLSSIINGIFSGAAETADYRADCP